MSTRSWWLFLVLVLTLSTSVNAQKTTSGKDFWLAFPQNAKYEFGQSIKQYIVVTAIEPAAVAITSPAMGTTGKSLAEGKTLQKGETYTFVLDSSLQCLRSETVEDKGIHVGSTGLIAVTALSSRKASNDSYRIMPVDALGKEYMIVGYFPPSTDQSFTSQFNVIAAEDNTTVKISLAASTKGGRKAGEVIEVRLDRGETYQVQGGGKTRTDLTGSIVLSDKPVAVLTGHSCAQVPHDRIYCDVLIEQSAPISTAGLEFIATMMNDKEAYDLRIVATQPNTIVQLGVNKEGIASEPRVLNAGEYADIPNVTDNQYLHADKPIIVAQYALSNEGDKNKVGDPFMTLVAPFTSYSSSSVFSTEPLKGYWNHYVSIVSDREAAGTLKLNGESLSSSLSHHVEGSDFVVYQTAVKPGTYSVTSNGRLAVYSYGFGTGSDNYDSYGTYCGPW
jgi:adhesin/invasin